MSKAVQPKKNLLKISLMTRKQDILTEQQERELHMHIKF